MIYTTILSSILDGHKVGNLLDNTNGGMVAVEIRAYRAQIIIREIVATATVAYVVSEAGNA
jgi:hypothetical protein